MIPVISSISLIVLLGQQNTYEMTMIISPGPIKPCYIRAQACILLLHNEQVILHAYISFVSAFYFTYTYSDMVEERAKRNRRPTQWATAAVGQPDITFDLDISRNYTTVILGLNRFDSYADSYVLHIWHPYQVDMLPTWPMHICIYGVKSRNISTTFVMNLSPPQQAIFEQGQDNIRRNSWIGAVTLACHKINLYMLSVLHSITNTCGVANCRCSAKIVCKNITKLCQVYWLHSD